MSKLFKNYNWLYFLFIALVAMLVMASCKTRQKAMSKNKKSVDSTVTVKKQSTTTQKVDSAAAAGKKQSTATTHDKQWDIEVVIEGSRVPISVKEGDFIIGAAADSLWKAGHASKVTIRQRGTVASSQLDLLDSAGNTHVKKESNSKDDEQLNGRVVSSEENKNVNVQTLSSGTGLYVVLAILVLAALIFFWFAGRPKGLKE